MSTPDTIADRETEIVEEFSMFDEWLDKYEHIIELGKSLAPMAADLHADEWKVKGCQSQVWLHPVREGDALVFQADSDAAITKGLVALMVRVLSGQPCRAIAQAPLSFLDRIGLHEHLSPTRSNGLASMVKQMKLYAAAYASQEASHG